MLVRMNPYRHSPPFGWKNIKTAPRDGTIIELQNNWGIAPHFGLCRWRNNSWQYANDENRGMGDGEHLSWRPWKGSVESYVDPTGGAQETEEYWDEAVVRVTGGLLNPAAERAKKRGER